MTYLEDFTNSRLSLALTSVTEDKLFSKYITTEDKLFSKSITTAESVARSEFIEVKIALMIDRIYVPSVVIIGVVGNFLSFFTLTFSSLRQTSTCVYMAVVALLDNVVLIFDFSLLIERYIGQTEFYLHSDWACGFHLFIFYFSIHFVTLTILAMTIDRYVVVKFPLKAQSWSTPKRALKVMFGLGLFSFALNFQIFFTLRMEPSGNPIDPLMCWYRDSEVGFFMQKIYTWIDASIYSFIPFISLLVLNVLIIRQLKKSGKFSKQFTDRPVSSNGDNPFKMPQDSGKEKNEKEEKTMPLSSIAPVFSNSAAGARQALNKSINMSITVISPPSISQVLKSIPTTKIVRNNASCKKSTSSASNNITVMLLLVSFLFLLLTSPVVIVLLYQRYYWLPTTEYELAKARLVHAVVDNLMYTNHAVNFPLYCLSGHRFRLEIRRFLCKSRNCLKQIFYSDTK